MSVKRGKKARPEVESVGKMHYIVVPRKDAAELLSYLRQHAVPASPPEPFLSDVDRIELARSVKPASVQELLDRWPRKLNLRVME